MACHLNVHHQIKNKGNTLTLSPPLWITSQDHRRPMPINPKNSTVVKGLIALKKDWKKNLISAFSKAFKKPFTQEIILLSSFTFTAPTFPIKTRQLYFSSSSICSETLSLPTHFELATARESFDSPKRETENETKLAESVRSKGENPLAEYNFWACFKAGFLPPPPPSRRRLEILICMYIECCFAAFHMRLLYLEEFLFGERLFRLGEFHQLSAKTHSK